MKGGTKKMTNRDVAAMKLRFFLDSNNITAQEVADTLRVSRKAVYAYRRGLNAVPDDYKKILEEKFGLNIYDVFYNPFFDKVATTKICNKETNKYRKLSGARTLKILNE